MKSVPEHLEEELMVFFRLLIKLYGVDAIRPKLSIIDQFFRFEGAGSTPVHKAIEAGYYKLVTEVFIDEMGFEPDFYTPEAKLTLMHTLVKKRGGIALDQSAKDGIILLIQRCHNISLRDNQGKTVHMLIDQYCVKEEEK